MLTAAALTGTAIPPATAAPGAGPSKPGPSNPGATQDGQSPDARAVGEAKRSGKTVEVAAKRTESSDTVAQPDGKLVTTTYVQPKRVRTEAVLENWNHLAVSYDAFSGRLTLYVNGQPENQRCADGVTGCTTSVSRTTAPRPFEATSGLQFGRTRTAGAWGEPFSGELDDVWLYQGVLSPAQIVKLADYNVPLDTSTGV
ncbi:LamG-like jellyroll fold domain-containing protein [Kitasatospora sp. NPDC048545]|uniref:LamG-like jellyroll fold domain-containing protein n=1 Tax=Kitasatospora sp. NPDC048545 TaxID=3157208 RepID=UPI0033FC845A